MDEPDVVGIALDALQLVAADASQQLALFPQWVPCGDEIALTVESAALLVAQEKGPVVPSALREAIETIDAEFEAMTQLREPELWSHEAIRGALRWQRLRNIARCALADMKVERVTPSLDGVIYVRADNFNGGATS